MVPPTEGTDFVPYSRDRHYLRLALIGVLAASLGLAACGRKGGLDAPPGASLASQPQPNQPAVVSTDPSAQAVGGQPTDNPAFGPDARPMAPKGEKKRIPLDVLLN
jgi:predicted small lipoprotein YifL